MYPLWVLCMSPRSGPQHPSIHLIPCHASQYYTNLAGNNKEDFIGFWKKAKEQTSSSFSGLHFGHYKTATQSPLLAEIHALMTQLAFSQGHPFDGGRQASRSSSKRLPVPSSSTNSMGVCAGGIFMKLHISRKVILCPEHIYCPNKTSFTQTKSSQSMLCFHIVTQFTNILL